MTTTQRPRAVLNLAKKKIPTLLAQAKAIYNALEMETAMFPSPTPPLPTLLTQIQALDTAEQVTATKAKGAAAARDAKRDVLCSSLETLQAYVQALVDASPEQGPAIITAAAMAVAKTPTHAKPILQAKLGAVLGTVELVANASLLTGKGVTKKVTFNWQYSNDGGKTWVSAPSTPLAHTSIPGLTPMTTYEFRVSVVISTTIEAWSQAVSILVR